MASTSSACSCSRLQIEPGRAPPYCHSLAPAEIRLPRLHEVLKEFPSRIEIRGNSLTAAFAEMPHRDARAETHERTHDRSMRTKPVVALPDPAAAAVRTRALRLSGEHAAVTAMFAAASDGILSRAGCEVCQSRVTEGGRKMPRKEHFSGRRERNPRIPSHKLVSESAERDRTTLQRAPERERRRDRHDGFDARHVEHRDRVDGAICMWLNSTPRTRSIARSRCSTAHTAPAALARAYSSDDEGVEYHDYWKSDRSIAAPGRPESPHRLPKAWTISWSGQRRE